MAIEVVNAYKEHFPALRLIGKRYVDADRDASGGFGAQWTNWNESNGFAALVEAAGVAPFCWDKLGLMTMRGDMTGFEYWIGLFFGKDAAVPDGYVFLDLPESDVGVGWVRGSMESGEIFGGPPHEAVVAKLVEIGIGDFRSDIAGEGSDTYCFYERYNDSRFCEKDADGNVTLDYGNYIKPGQIVKSA